MNPYEEELQKKIARGEVPGDEGMDVKAYQRVFRALEKDPGYKLSPDFARRVASRVIASERKKSFNDYVWFAAGIIFFLVAFAGTVLYTGFRLDFGFLNVMSEYKELAAFGISFIFLLNWLDKKLVKEKQVHHRF